MPDSSKPICQLLLEDSIITEKNVDEALAIQKNEGGKVGSILIKMGVLDTKTLMKYLDIQLELVRNKTP